MKNQFCKLLSFLAIIICLFPTKSKALNPTDFTITRITAPYFIVDGNLPTAYTSCYVGFEVKNNTGSGVTYSKLRFSITSIGTSIVGQNYTLVSPADGITNIGTLAPGQTKVCYYYVTYPTAAGNQPQAVATFNLRLSDTTANAKTQTFDIYNRSSISANAGGLTQASVNNQDLLGGIILDTITYTVGNVRNGDENDFQVAVSPSYDPTKLILLSTKIIESTVPQINVGTTDSLYFISGNGSTGAYVKVLWKFRITNFGFTNYLLPCAGATSGNTNYKYALNTALGQGLPITVSASANTLSISKTSDKNSYCSSVDSYAKFTITVSNSSIYNVSIDKILDTLPAGFSFAGIDPTSDVNSANSVVLPANNATNALSFEGGVLIGSEASYTVPAGGNIKLVYRANIPGSNTGRLITAASAIVATTNAGTAKDTVIVSCRVQPVAVNDIDSTNEDTPLYGNLSLNDSMSINGTNLWSLVSNPSNGTLTINSNGTYVYTPNPNFNGKDTFYYKLCDSLLNCSTARVIITINPVNDLPIANDDVQSTNEDTPVSGSVTGNDVQSGDGGNTWSLTNNVTHGTLNLNSNGSYTYTPSANYNGRDTFYYRLCDVNSDCDTAMVVITINPVNDLPIANDDVQSTNEDTPVSGSVTGNDVQSGDGGNTWSVTSNVTNGTLNFNLNGTYTYTPTANYNGIDTFYYKLCDVNSDCDTAMVVITINPVNDLPIANDDTTSTSQNIPVNGILSSNDILSGDGGNNWSILNNPLNGNVVINPDGSYIYTPTTGFFGIDTFYYKICDSNSDCDTAIVTINVNIVLPVKLVSFSAQWIKQNNAKINWKVISENNIHHYELLRSYDGKVFSISQIVNSKRTTGELDYSCNDTVNANNLKVVYYRFKIVGIDGNFEYSNIVSLKINTVTNNDEISVFPSPFVNSFKVEINSHKVQPATIRIFTTEGNLITRKYAQLVLGKNIINVDNIGSLPSANYLIEIATDSDKFIQKVFKNAN